MLVSIVVAVVVLDQITKYVVMHFMSLGMSIPIIQDIFHFTYIRNPGAAFGILKDNRWFFILTAVLVLLLLVFWRKKLDKEPLIVKVGIALFAGGTFGNLIDRIHFGEVVDFFDFRIWPIFNVADIAICLGVGLILWYTLIVETKKAA